MFEGALGAEKKIVQERFFLGKRDDNKILKVQVLPLGGMIGDKIITNRFWGRFGNYFR